jgi:hypothetical protein
VHWKIEKRKCGDLLRAIRGEEARTLHSHSVLDICVTHARMDRRALSSFDHQDLALWVTSSLVFRPSPCTHPQAHSCRPAFLLVLAASQRRMLTLARRFRLLPFFMPSPRCLQASFENRFWWALEVVLPCDIWRKCNRLASECLDRS